MITSKPVAEGRTEPALAPPHDGIVRLRELLAEPDLHVETVTQIHDGDRAIRYVYPTELVDPSRYLSGDELILSVGVPVADQSDEAIRRYVGTLTGQGVTALLVGLGDLFDEPPAALVKACQDLDLPLLAQRAAVPFRRIVDWAESTRAADREIGTRERDLGSILRWFVAGTLGVGPVENALARAGLAEAPVMVCAFTSDAHARVHEVVDRHSGTVALLEDRIVALCAHTEEFTTELAASTLVCGLAVASDAQSMAHAIPEALEALHEAIRWRRSVHIDEIATLEGLLAAVPKVRLVPFVQRLIVPLVDHDKVNSSYLVASLESFLSPRNDISTAANEVYVHVNTLRNRLAKIAELTGANPLEETDRINFRIALWAAHNMGMRDGVGENRPASLPRRGGTR
ncbi:PucR family transcriptional regulator ligand-binding domain-containing protein [Mycobacterium sp. 21AC1]|uniref:PucR family transcriptional regulator n=1 Tax=[Mycobacterium] appelbergii TaxID=2939269 RepID=UPI002938F632|nr:PucR family transcriptional regulator ligand-binding domain-containing protein [Mycobacterium sp. 21AC1]MDV3127997.1 PucR family transcriptional regulator ligand-binding domain-containing protein [Mycobacterium sp. 21AC1]